MLQDFVRKWANIQWLWYEKVALDCISVQINQKIVAWMAKWDFDLQLCSRRGAKVQGCDGISFCY